MNVKKTISVIGLSFFIWVTLSASVLAVSSSVDLTIVYSNNIIGQIEPCPT